MHKRLLSYMLFIVMVLTIIVLPLQVVHAASESENSDPDRSFTIDRVNIRAQLLNDGDMEVEELHTYTFDGAYHETIRTIGEEGHKGIEFFKAYAVGNEFDLNEWEPAKFQQLPALKVTTATSKDEDLLVYQAALSADHETKSVLYHYRVSQVMREEDDIEHWNWKFFDDRNPSDLNQLYVEVELPRAISWDQGLSYDAYTYGSSDGTLDIKDDRFISYDYPYFPAGEPLDVRISFPMVDLAEQDTPVDGAPSALMTEQKSDLQDWHSLSKLSVLITILFVLVLIPLLLWQLCIIPLWYRMSVKRYIRMDFLQLQANYSVEEWNPRAILAGALSLRRRGVIDIDFKDVNRSAKAPNVTFYCLDESMLTLHADEQYFIDWLFASNEQGVFSTRSIFLPAVSRRESLYQRNQNRQRLKKIYAHLSEWKELIRKRIHLPDPSTNLLIRGLLIVLGYGLASVLFVFCLWIQDQNIIYIHSPIVYWIGFPDPSGYFFSRWFDPFYYLGMGAFAGVIIALFWALVMSSAQDFLKLIINKLFKEGSMLKRIALGCVTVYRHQILHFAIALSFILNVTWLCALNPPNFQLGVIVCAILVCVLMCFYPLPTHKMQVVIQQLKDQLMNGKYKQVADPEIMDWLFQASLIMECADEFLSTHPNVTEIANQHPEYELLAQSHQLVYVVKDVWGSISTFEQFEQNEKARKERNRIAKQQTKAGSSYYSSSSDSSSSSYYSSDSSSYSSDSSSSSSSDSSDSGGGGGSSSD